MNPTNSKVYIAIDLKSFYASVECVERGHDPLTTNLIVADVSRTEKTICLAVSPSLKSFGIPGRPRLFEVIKKVSQVNEERKKQSGTELQEKSWDYNELKSDSSLAVDYIAAVPQMALYMKISAKIYEIYLKYVSAEDIHIYSIDEVFIDITPYLSYYNKTPHQIAMMMIKDVLKETGITATCGIGTNLFLAKVAMDITAKHQEADKDGVRIAELDQMSYRRLLWNHKPLTDFWRIGHGTADRLAKYRLYTMGDIARFSLTHSEMLYKEFGINAELIIDHAWGVENCTMKDIKNYKPKNSSLSSGQVLQKPYSFDKARIVIREMAEELALSLVKKELLTNRISIYAGYDAENIIEIKDAVSDYYNRLVPKPVNGGINFNHWTSSSRDIADAAVYIFDSIINRDFTVRRLNVCAESVTKKEAHYEQGLLFDDSKKEECEKQNKLDHTVVGLKERFGKNSVLKGVNFIDGSTQRLRNTQIGGHKA